MRAWLGLFGLLIVSLGSCAAVGTGSSALNGGHVGCYAEVARTNGLNVGKFSDHPFRDNYYAIPVPSVTGIDSSAAGQNGGTGYASSITGLDPCTVDQSGILYTHAATSGSAYLPWMTLVNTATGGLTTAQIGSDTTITCNQGHDSPAWAFDLPGAKGGIGYGAESTSTACVNTPTASWKNSTWNATSGYAMPFKLGNCLGGGGGCWDNAANEYFLPTPGMSELAMAANNMGPGGIGLTCGQGQTNVAGIMFSGNHDCLTWRINSAGTDVCFDVYAGASYSCAIDTTATTGSAWGSNVGTMELTTTPASSDYFYFTFTCASCTAGTETVTANGCTFTFSVTAAMTSAQAAAAAVSSANSTCSNNTSYLYVNGTGSCGTACFMVEYKAAGWPGYASVPAAPSTTCSAGLGVTCSANTTIWNTSGYHHFLWGGPQWIKELGEFVDFMDVQLQTTTAQQGYNNSIALTGALFFSRGPNSTGVWTWGSDANIDNPFTTQPGDDGSVGFKLGMGPGGSCAFNTVCTEPDGPSGTSPYLIEPPSVYPTNFKPLCYDWGSAAQVSCVGTSASVPMGSQETLAYYNKKLYLAFPNFISSSGNGYTGIGILEIDPYSKVTTNAWWIQLSDVNTIPYFNPNLELLENPNGSGLTLYIGSGDGGHTLGCLTSGLCVDKATFNGTTWSGLTKVTSVAGTNTTGSVCQFSTDMLRLDLVSFCFNGATNFTPNNPIMYLQGGP